MPETTRIMTLDDAETNFTFAALVLLERQVRDDSGKPGADDIGHTEELADQLGRLALKVWANRQRPIDLDTGELDLLVSALEHLTAEPLRRPGADAVVAGKVADRLLDRFRGV